MTKFADITFYLPAEVLEAIEIEAKKEGVSAGALCASFLSDKVCVTAASCDGK